MLLYATTTSERASKGQGGNEYLDIVITEGTFKNVIAKIEVLPPKYALSSPQLRLTYNFHLVDVTIQKPKSDFWGVNNKEELQ